MTKSLTTSALGDILDSIAENRKKGLPPMNYHALKIASHVCHTHNRGRAIEMLEDLGEVRAAHGVIFRRAAKTLRENRQVF